MSKRQDSRTNAQVKPRKPSTPDGWRKRWKQSLDRLEHAVTDLRDAKNIYKTFNKVVFDNPQIDKSNEFLLLIETMYETYILANLRTLYDTDERSESLHNLIREICAHRELLSKEWYLSPLTPRLARRATRWYEHDWGEGDCPAKNKLQDDVVRLKQSCEKARKIVNKYIAHTDRQPPTLTLNWKEVHQAIDTLFEMWQRYRRLVMRSPIIYDPPEDWEGILDKPIRAS